MRRQSKRRLELVLRMAEAKARLIERKMLPRAYCLAPEEFELYGRPTFDFVPVRKRKSLNRSCIYSSTGCSVGVPVRL